MDKCKSKHTIIHSKRDLVVYGFPLKIVMTAFTLGLYVHFYPRTPAEVCESWCKTIDPESLDWASFYSKILVCMYLTFLIHCYLNFLKSPRDSLACRCPACQTERYFNSTEGAYMTQLVWFRARLQENNHWTHIRNQSPLLG